eukprot:gene23884-30993_t
MCLFGLLHFHVLVINESSQWKQLEEHSAVLKQPSYHLRSLLQDPARSDALVAEHKGIVLDFSRQNLIPETLDKLCDLAVAAGLEEKRSNMANGVHINATEDRAVMHVALRCPKGKSLYVDGEDVVPAVHNVLEKIAGFSKRVRDNEWIGATGKPLTSVLSIGIGGSYLGPEFVFEALRTDDA